MSGKLKIDWEKLIEEEGGSQRKAYVPAVKEGKSGLTIGIGLDMKSKDEKFLKDEIGLNEEEIKPFLPYLKKGGKSGIKGKEAHNRLKKNPLIISKETEEKLNNNAKKSYQRYADRLTKGLDVENMPDVVQHAIGDTIYNTGGIPFRRDLEKGDYLSFGKKLSNYRDSAKGNTIRRRKRDIEIQDAFKDAHRPQEFLPIIEGMEHFDPDFGKISRTGRGPASEEELNFFNEEELYELNRTNYVEETIRFLEDE